jgi:threonine/homoserine/homoserine lactone efflux protein
MSAAHSLSLKPAPRGDLSIELFIKGLFVGVAIAAPVGPIGLLCIQRALTGGWISGLASGLGAALADTFYGGIAAFGLSLVQDFLFGHRSSIAVIGGVLLCLLGLRIILAKPATMAARPRKSAAGLAGDLVGTFMLTLANPMTILSFIAIFAALNTSAASDSYVAAATLVLGVFGGSAAWWLCLSFGIGVIRHRMDQPALRWISRGSGALILVFGATAAWHGMMS